MVAIRFGRARGARKACDRPNGRSVIHLGDGRWWDEAAGAWRDGRGRQVPVGLGWCCLPRPRHRLRREHQSHRCLMIHDEPEHRLRRWTSLFRGKALGDLLRRPYG